MGLLLAAVPLALLAGLVARRQIARHSGYQALPPDLLRLARAAGDDPAPAPDGARGRRDGTPWEIAPSPGGYALTVEGAPVELRAAPAQSDARFGADVGARLTNALPFGEALFDEQVLVEGPPLLLAAALDPGCRARLIRLIRDGGTVSGGAIRLPLPPPPAPGAWAPAWSAEAHAHIGRCAALLRDLHRWQQDSPDLPDRLLSALTDAPRRRELALQCLSRHWPDRLTARHLRDLRADPDPHVQAEALIHLQAWEDLAALLASPRPEIRRRVLTALPAGWLYTLTSAANAAWHAASHRRAVPAADQLLSLLDEIARRADPAAEPFLLGLDPADAASPAPRDPQLRALLDPTSSLVFRATARALGAVGGRDAAAALWPLRDHPAARQEVADALARIRERLGAADVGHVQIASDAGALALADLSGALSEPGAPNRPFPDAGDR